MEITTFDHLTLTPPLRRALTDIGLEHPTWIQEHSFSAQTAGRDVVCIAQTGTGKTFAYLLPALRQWAFAKVKLPQIVIVVPTRELVVQVVEEVNKLAIYMPLKAIGVYGGTSMNTQIAQVLQGMDLLVATPGRLIDLVLHGSLKLKTVKKLIIDEVDEMLSLGFRTQLIQLLDLMPPKRQNVLFSATLTIDVEAFIMDNFPAAAKIEAVPSGTPLDTITQTKYNVPNFNTKVSLLQHLLATDTSMDKVLVFVSSKRMADMLFAILDAATPLQFGLIHGNKDQNYRFKSVKMFDEGSRKVLIATDIIARGLDLLEVTHVINFDLPEVAENYIHRIGRTGRAKRQGNSIAFVSEAEQPLCDNIENMMSRRIPLLTLPQSVPIATILIDDEIPKIRMKSLEGKLPSRENSGLAFHDKKDKNKKVNNKIHRAEELKMKYKKPKTRGDKFNKKK